MRAFISVDIPPVVSSSIASSVYKIAVRFPSVKFPFNPAFHVTLRFFPDIDENIFAEISRRMENFDLTAFDVRVKGFGFFPNSPDARVFWAAVESPYLSHIYSVIEDISRGCGIAGESQRFTPHVTLARMKKPHPELFDFVRNLSPEDFGGFDCEKISFYKSEISSAKVKHSLLHCVHLSRGT